MNTQTPIHKAPVRPLLVSPRKLPSNNGLILVHRCFSQIEGKTKASKCGCKERVSASDAAALVAQSKADYFLVRNVNSENLVPFHRAIVIRATRDSVKEFKTRRKDGKRFVSFLEIEADILQKFRKFLLIQFRGGNLPQGVANLNESMLKTFLREPDLMAGQFPEFQPTNSPNLLRRKLLRFSAQWWNDVLGFNRCDEEVGQYIPNTLKGEGKSLLEYSDNLQDISAHTRAHSRGSNLDTERSATESSFDFAVEGNRRTAVANHRASHVDDGTKNGAWDYSTGKTPTVDEDTGSEEYAASFESHFDKE